MFSILNRALSWAITSFGNKFCQKKRSSLIKALDNRLYVKFMQLEIGLLPHCLFFFGQSQASEINAATIRGKLKLLQTSVNILYQISCLFIFILTYPRPENRLS